MTPRLAISYVAALILLLPVGAAMLLSGVVCLALHFVSAPFAWLHERCREFFLYLESGAWRNAS